MSLHPFPAYKSPAEVWMIFRDLAQTIYVSTDNISKKIGVGVVDHSLSLEDVDKYITRMSRIITSLDNLLSSTDHGDLSYYVQSQYPSLVDLHIIDSYIHMKLAVLQTLEWLNIHKPNTTNPNTGTIPIALDEVNKTQLIEHLNIILYSISMSSN